MLVDRSWGDLCLIGSCLIGAVDRCFVTEMVWIRSKGRVDLCSEIGIEIGTKMGT